MARRDEGEYPTTVFDREVTKPDGPFLENPPGGGSFGRGGRWLGHGQNPSPQNLKQF